MKMKNQIKNLAVAFGAALIGGVLSLSLYQAFVDEEPTHTPEVQGEPTKANYEIKTVNVPNFDFTEVSEKVTSSVVHIKTERGDDGGGRHPFEEFFEDRFEFDGPGPDGRGPGQGVGSGVILDESGYIITNLHVIQNASKIHVNLDDNREYEARVIGEDPHTDLAVLKIDAPDLTPLQFGDSDQLDIGEWVVAVGNPFNLRSTVTAGIVSAKARNINLLGGGASIESFIQTDAAVNPGNSGGALVNTSGELIGINTAIATQTGQYAGYSFAIPSNIAYKVYNDIVEFGDVKRGFIGVTIEDVDHDLAKEKGLDEVSGAVVRGLMEGGAAEDAGIKEGDVIIQVDDQEITSVPHLQEYVGLHRPGDEILVTVFRDGETIEFEVTLRTQEGRTALLSDDRENIKEKLGAEFETVTEAHKEEHGISNGVVVIDIGEGKLKEAGVPEGFIITKIDNQAVHTPGDIFSYFEEKQQGGVLLEGVNPDGSQGYYGFGLEG